MPKLELYQKYKRTPAGAITRSASRGGGASPGVAEGPGIDVSGNRVGLGGDAILLYDADGSPVAEYSPNSTGMAGAITDATAGDVISLPAYTIDGSHTIPASVQVSGFGANSVLSGTITNSGILNNVQVSGTLTNSATLDWAIDENGYWQTTRRIGIGISPRCNIHVDDSDAVMRVSSPDTANPTLQVYFRDGANYSGWALLRDGQGGSDDFHINWDATEASATRTDISIQDTTGQVVLGGTNAEVPIAVARARLICIGDGIQVQTTIQNAALTLNAGTGAAAGSQVAFIDLKLNNVLKGNIACSEATSGNPLEINSSVATNISMVTGGGSVGVGLITPAAKLHVDQASGTGAKPVLTLDQADIDQVLVKVIGTAAAASADRTLVADSDYGTPGALAGWIQVGIQDDGDRVTDGDYYIPFYAVPT